MIILSLFNIVHTVLQSYRSATVACTPAPPIHFRSQGTTCTASSDLVVAKGARGRGGADLLVDSCQPGGGGGLYGGGLLRSLAPPRLPQRGRRWPWPQRRPGRTCWPQPHGCGTPRGRRRGCAQPRRHGCTREGRSGLRVGSRVGSKT